jgi:hypothetical protein
VNYTQLVAAIEDYVETTESTFVSNIPTFVQLAEERIYNSVQIPAIRKNQVGNLTASNKYLTLPTDWLATFSLAVVDPTTSAQSFLLNKDVNYIREAFPTPSDTGTPTHYAQFDSTSLIIGPTPDASYSVELHYYYYPASIVTAGTSWLGDNFETVLLYGSLREAVIFQKGEADIIANYEAKYQESLMLLKVLGDGKDRRDAYRSGQTRVEVP